VVELEKTDNNFTNDTAADRPETLAIFHELSFLENVVPERRGLVEILTKVFQLYQVLCGQ
jgi:hypothetical protein